MFADHHEFAEAGQAVGDLAGNAIAEILLARITAEVFEGQDDDDRLALEGRMVAGRCAGTCGGRRQGTGIFVAAALHRDDHLRAKGLPQGGNMDLQRVVLDHEVRPDCVHQLCLANQFMGPLKEQGEDVEGAAREIDRTMGTGEQSLLSLETVLAEVQVHAETTLAQGR